MDSEALRTLIIILLIQFSTVLIAQYATEITVAQDGSGDYTSLQEAIDNTKSYPDKRITIHVKPGRYREKVEVYAWNTNVTIDGGDADSTIIAWDDHFDKIDKGRNSTFHTATLRIRGSGFTGRNLTVVNDAGPVGQAIAVYNEADRSTLKHCRIIGNQDVLFVDGAPARQYYVNCYIEGTTDFIFGGATAVFDSCTIHSKANSFITAASTPEYIPFGFVFIDCEITADDDVNQVYLGRPWRSHASTSFIHCEMGRHIHREGWDNWSNPENERTARYLEMGNYGPGASTEARPNWITVKELTSSDTWNSRDHIRAVFSKADLPEFDVFTR